MSDEENEAKPEENERDLWVAEFSLKQRAFHVEPLKLALAANMSAIVESTISQEIKSPEFVIFGVYLTREKADEAVERLRKLLIEGGMKFP